MSYKGKPQIKLYKYVNSQFELQAIIDDFLEVSFQHSLYEAGDFTISINYNIPNALLFQRGMFVQLGNNPYAFGEITKISDKVDENGKGGQLRTIIGKDARYIFKRRIIKSLNSADTWSMTDKGELCLRNLIKDQCGSNAEEKRQLPITNTIPTSANAIGNEYSVSEAYTNLYDVLVTIATQSEIGWRVKFENGLILEVYQGNDISDSVQFSTDFDSLRNGEFTDTSDNYINAVYVGGKGQGEYRDIYEGESSIENESPEGLERFECWDNQNAMTSEAEYETEALSLLSQYGQTVNVDGNGLAKSPYIFGEAYNVGDIITIGFSGKKAIAQILSVTEHWSWNRYDIEFSFGKPVNDLSRQLQLILRQIQKAKTDTVNSVKWYTMTSNVTQEKADIVYNTIGFTGAIGTGKTFAFFLDSEQTGAKKYNVYVKNLTGTGSVTLTTGVSGAENFLLNTGTYVTSIYIDEDGNVLGESIDVTDVVESGSTAPVSSGGVYNAIQDLVPVSILQSLPTDAVLHYSFDEIPDLPDGTAVAKNLNGDTYNVAVSSVGTISFDAYTEDGKIHKSNVNGNANYKANVGSNRSLGIYFGNTGGTGLVKIIEFVAKTPNLDVHIFYRQNQSDTKTVTYPLGNSISIGKHRLVVFVPQNCFEYSIVFYSYASDLNYTEWELTGYYLGDGSYSTPVIDNANGQWNGENSACVANQGISGKGIFLSKYSYVKTSYNNLSNLNEWSLSFWINLKRGTNQNPRLYRFGSAEYCFVNNFNTTGNDFTFYTYQNSNYYIKVSLNLSQYYETFAHIVIVTTINVNGTSRKRVYINGKSISSASGTITQVPSFNYGYIGGSGDNNQSLENSQIDDFQIFERALSETEVKALYYNNANTPKYYSRADWKLEQMVSGTRSVKSESEEEPKEEEKKDEEPIDEEKENER